MYWFQPKDTHSLSWQIPIGDLANHLAGYSFQPYTITHSTLGINTSGHGSEPVSVEEGSEIQADFERSPTAPPPFTLLPHQACAADAIALKPRSGAVLADAVGTGKTIVIGEAIQRLRRDHGFHRILILAKASQVDRFAEELNTKSELNFDVYNKDFVVRSADKWSRYESIIASADLVKPRSEDDLGNDFGTHFGKLLAAGTWDAIFIDEAHHFVHPEGERDSNLYRLASALRPLTPMMVLATGTPHQGDTDRFHRMLKLARPDLAQQIDDPMSYPEAVRKIVVRARKADITDRAANFLIRGHDTWRLELTPNKPYLILESALEDYLCGSHFAKARDETGIGDVPSYFRKLFSSSISALESGLNERLNNVQPRERFGRGSLNWVRNSSTAEGDVIRKLLKLCALAAPSDRKLKALNILHHEFVEKGGRKVIIFAEFLATQEWAIKELERLSPGRVAMMNGSHDSEQKAQAISFFEQEADVLVCTEAGAEGFNIQSKCHVVINLDMPWNPMRLEQRIWPNRPDRSDPSRSRGEYCCQALLWRI